MSGASILKNVELTRIFKELKSKNSGIQMEASRKLYNYLLKHNEDCDDIFEEFNELLQSNEKENKLGCFIAINKILTVGRETRLVHFVNKILPTMFKQMKSNNPELLEKAAECLGNLAKAGGSITADNVEKTLDQVLEWLADKNVGSKDIKRYSAVLVLREFLRKLPIVTFNKLFDQGKTYKNIFAAFKLPSLRTMQTFNIQPQLCLELLYQAKQQGEQIINKIMHLNDNTKNQHVKKKCIELIPILAKYIQSHFNSSHLQRGMISIFQFIEKKENISQKGYGFIALGKMSLLITKQQFSPYLEQILKLINKEIEMSIKSSSQNQKYQMNLEVLTCVKMFLKNYGEWLDTRINIISFINDIFYSGFNKQLIDTLNELSKICNGKYRVFTQIKLLNAISVILTQKISLFPIGSEFLKRSHHAGGGEHATLRETFQNSFSPTKDASSYSPDIHEERKTSLDNNTGLNQMFNLNKSTFIGDQETQDKNQLQVSRTVTLSKLEEGADGGSHNNPLKIDQESLKKLLQRQCSEFLLSQVQQSNSQSSSSSSQQDNSFATQKTQLVTLALKTLANYDFTEFQNVTQFIETSVLTYLDDENPQVRKEAVKTCCSLSFSTQLGQSQQRLGAVMVKMVNKLLHKFFETATTDNDYRIRTTMLKYLNSQFDPFISKYENLLMLFNCMQDQNFDIKDKTIKILGRLVPYNSSQIYPYLRNLIVQLLNQLEHSQDPKEREEAAKLIKTFVRSNKDLSKQYANPILNCLIKKIDGEQATSAFISAILEAIGEVSLVDCDAVKPYMGQLFPLVLECIKDQSSVYKREVSIRTLIYLIENTGFVVKPYFFFPEIINHLRNLVQNEQSPNIRKLVFKLIGALGALDPYLVKQITIYYNSHDGLTGENHSNINLLYMIDQQLHNPNFKAQDNNMDKETQQSIFKHMLKQRIKNKEEASAQHISSNNDNVDKTEIMGANNNNNVTLFNNQVGNKRIDMNKYLKQYDFQETKEIKYPTKAIEQMIRVLLDPTLRDHHYIVLSGIKYIVHTLSQDSIVFLPLIIPPIMILIQANDTVLNESLYQCINAIIATVPKSINKFQDIIFETINDVLNTQSLQVLELIRLLNIHCKDNSVSNSQSDLVSNQQVDWLFISLHLLLPKILQLIETKKNTDIDVSIKGVQTLREFNIQVLNDHLYIIIPLLLRICSNGISQIEIKLNIEVIQMIDTLKECVSFREHIAQIIHQLIQTMETQISQNHFVTQILRLFCSLAQKLTIDFAPYISLIQKTIKRNRLLFDPFEEQIEKIIKKDPILLFFENLQNTLKEEEEIKQIQQQQQNALQNQQQKKSIVEVQESRKKHINFETLLREFDTSKCSIEADWIEWLKKTSNQLLKQSPSPILFACSTLAEVYAPIATELYNIAFVSCWKIMTDKGKEKIMENYRNAINSKNKPTIVLQTILNLAEFMELDETIDLKLFGATTLANIAEQCNAYAKALYYWEMEFENDPKSTIELLIKTNYGLQQPEAAQGILDYAKKNLLMVEKEDWYEKLRKWRDALKIYIDKETLDPDNFEILKGKLNCFRNLSDWENLSYQVEKMWTTYSSQQNNEEMAKSNNQLKEIAEHASYSAWNLGEWDNFQKYVKMLDIQKNSYEKNFYQAILDIKSNKYTEGQKHIDKAREILDPKITSLLGESYNRAYLLIQEMQHLRELEEIIDFKTCNDDGRKKHLYSLWCKRLEYQPPQDFEAWQKSFNLRSLVIDKSEEIDSYLKFAKLALDSENRDLGSKVLQNLKIELKNKSKELKTSKLNNQLAKVEFAIYQNVFNQGQCKDAIIQLEKLLQDRDDLEPALKSEFCLKLGQWNFETAEIQKTTLKEQDYQIIISYCEKATQQTPKNQEAWHYYSLMNYEACLFYQKKFLEETNQGLNSKDAIANNAANQLSQQFIFDDFSPQTAFQIQQIHSHSSQQQKLYAQKYIFHVVQSIKALISQLSLCDYMQSTDMTKTLQNTLRLLKLWYRHGNHVEIEEIVREGFQKIDLKVWINVIPQLLARVDIKDKIIRRQLIDLLERISQKFPQALIYSLSVLQKSKTQERRQAADQLIEKLKQKQPVLIEQATFISDGLIRCAIVLAEIWNEAIEEASRIFFGQNDAKAMINYLAPYHKMMEDQPETMNEIAFYQGYASDLLEAEGWTKRYLISKCQYDINQAWDLYLSVFRKISVKLKEVQFYELRNVAPKLLAEENLDIAVPGTFKSDRQIIKIKKLASVLPVLASKQHPRKLLIYGSDGREYMFLLKGHEDIRQDERVMQLFGLVNTLLSIDPQTSKKDLSIRRYPVIPLSQNSGLIGWVPNCDTLHQLIKEHRSQANIIPNIEYKLMEAMCEHFDICPLPNKVEIFRYALDRTMGEDLQRVLWLKSQNSELWLERRTNYTRSLAVMSMVGYILGLGDRHPSNIMLDRFSGKIIHIDFGDCFEIAMRREKFPEKIPFRLTRMLINAMEVSGIEGNFRTTCENTMRVMRASKDSMLAILEAFVYDPLISFKLLNPKLIKQHQQQKQQEGPGALPNQQNTANKAEEEKNAGIVNQNLIHKRKQSVRGGETDKILDRIQKVFQPINKEDAQGYAESKFSRKLEEKELMLMIEEEGEEVRRQELNSTAEIVIQRISDKLRGNEFYSAGKGTGNMDINNQVDNLIKQATSHENLAQCYIGWCPYW